MEILSGQKLVDELRSVSNRTKRRLWIAVPFIGSDKTITSVLGVNWFENPNITVKLLTDASDFNNLNISALNLFIQRGEIRDLLGLHAKIYLLDDECFVTSANLTNTAFAKRYEIGCHISGNAVKSIEKIFNDWWRISKPVKTLKLADIFNKKNRPLSKEEKSGLDLPSLWRMPSSSSIKTESIKKKFLDYPLVIQEYERFADLYKSIQRRWKKYPLYLEIDTFLNYMYHEAPRRPSHRFKDRRARRLSETEQKIILKTYAKQFVLYLESEDNPDHISEQINHHKILKQTLIKRNIKNLTKTEVVKVFDNINALNSYPINKTRILNNNTLQKIRQSLFNLLYSNDQLPARMSECAKIKFMGTSTINEILGYHNPGEYPIVNRNSSAGLRFFGFNVPKYR